MWKGKYDHKAINFGETNNKQILNAVVVGGGGTDVLYCSSHVIIKSQKYSNIRLKLSIYARSISNDPNLPKQDEMQVRRIEVEESN